MLTCWTPKLFMPRRSGAREIDDVLPGAASNLKKMDTQQGDLSKLFRLSSEKVSALKGKIKSRRLLQQSSMTLLKNILYIAGPGVFIILAFYWFCSE